MRAGDLTGEALRIFEAWLSCGYSEQQALEEVERSGVAVEQELTEVFESFGMNPQAARIAARGRDGGAPGHPFDEAVQRFERLGMSPEAARIAAIGRDGTESQARRLYSEAARPQAPAAVVEAPKLSPVASKPNVVPLAEHGSTPALPAVVARSDELQRQGVPAHDAPRRAFRELYGHDPRGAA